MSLELFLRALFRHLGPSFIEIRAIEDKKAGELIERKFYKNPTKLLADLDRLRKVAESGNAAIFFGVLPRREPGKGTAKDTINGLVVWCDLDFKDFAGGEAEARARLQSFPIPPSIVVRSGHGLHVYFLLREPTDPQELSRLSKAIARALGGDHAFDAARVLRVPETFNRKDPEHPVLVEIEVLDEERAYNASEIEDALHLVGVAPDEPEADRRDNGNEGGRSVRPGKQLSSRVLELLETKRDLKALYEGKGKPVKGLDGRDLDRSRSGYDFSVAYVLFRFGVHDFDEVATAIALRPDAAQTDIPYLTRTVNEAWKRYEEVHGSRRTDTKGQVDFEVERVLIFKSVPASYQLVINGITVTFTSAQLKSKSKFGTRFLDVLNRVPRLPRKQDNWEQVVNSWLARAEIVELPEDASDEGLLREDVLRAIKDLPEGQEAADLDHGQAILYEGKHKAFKAAAVRRLLLQDHPELKPHELSRHLKEMGFTSAPRYLGGDTVRTWCAV